MSDAVENLSHESRTFAPPAEFASAANVKSEIFARAESDRLAFWESQARELKWEKPWTKVLDWQAPFAKWFLGGELNISVNCLDRHIEAGIGDRVALYFEGEPGDSRAITYSELFQNVKQTANALTELGISKGDRVAIYLPMIQIGRAHV